MNLRTAVDVQFSKPFGAAAARVYGRAFLDQFTLQNVTEDLKAFFSGFHPHKID